MAIIGFFQQPTHYKNGRDAWRILVGSLLILLIGFIATDPIQAADLTTPEAQKKLDSSLTQKGINYTVMDEGVDSQRIIMNSDISNIIELRKALHSLPPEQSLLRPQAKITVSGHIPKNKKVQLILESNPATGYRWEFSGSTDEALIQDGEDVYEGRGLIGGSAKQAIQVKSNKEGYTEANFIYKRPWEDGRLLQATSGTAPNQVTIQLDEIPDVIDLTNPNTPIHKSLPLNMQGDAGLELNIPNSQITVATLPSAWDWRSSGAGLTPIRDQGNCGSCWAFATVGALESAFKVKIGSDVNASEQFLVSCNNNGYDCSGGWFAHDYHANILGKLQAVAGSVSEVDMPYTVSNGTCKVVSNHPNRISSWRYIAGYVVPSVDQIKSAIYEYGSVSAAVCVGSAFQAYRSGVFSTDESAACGSGEVNHAIVLVGWEDATQTWILRNSWGPNWAEQGYMRIKWGTSNVGFGANYVQLTQGASQTISAISFSPATLAVSGTTTASATATSNLAVSFSSKTTTVCTVSGNTVKGVKAGTCTIAANQAGNAAYNPAPQVTQNLTVGGKTNQTLSPITFNPATLAVGGTTTASATATSNLAVSFSSKTTKVCTVSGNTVKGVKAGTCTIAANQAGNAAYNAAPQVTQNLTVGGSQSYTLKVSKAGSGAGTVTSSPTGINCGAACSYKFSSGTTVTLTAAPASGSVFGGWSDQGCTGTPTTCTVIVTFNKATAATMTAPELLPSLEIKPELEPTP